MHLHVINSTNRISTARANQDNCRDIIAYAAAELRDAAEGRQVRPCPVLTALATVNPKKSAPGMSIYTMYNMCFSLYVDYVGCASTHACMGFMVYLFDVSFYLYGFT